MTNVANLFEAGSSNRVLVVGDVILDEYIFGIVERVSPEAPVPVVKVERVETRPGGAANVAANVAGVGVGVSLLGMCGRDSAAKTLAEQLVKHNVDSLLISHEATTTIVKRRVVAHQQQLLRIDEEVHLSANIGTMIYERFLESYQKYRVVILSDYGKGALQNHQRYIDACNSKGIKVLIDPKGGDFDRYKGATLITPNLREFEQIVGASSSQSERLDKARALKDKLSLEFLIITLGADGILLIDDADNHHHLSSEARQVFDVSGAGDTVIAILAALMSTGRAVKDALVVANAAAGIVVGKLGTSIVTKQELNSYLSNPAAEERDVLTLEELISRIISLKAQGLTIVMTNGCFDILHPGHVAYLEKAKKLGDILVVAINTDESVRRIKGPKRPINNFESRAKLLRALRPVDYVVAFDQDTPELLYGEVLPHILVKGSDYLGKELAGASAVTSNGGKIELIDFIDGYSSSNIIHNIATRYSS